MENIQINRFAEFSSLYQSPDVKFDLDETDKFVNATRGDEVVVNFLNWIFPYATSIKASDVHLSDGERGCTVRIRAQNTDLHPEFILSRIASQEIARRIRARCKMNVTDHERTQDGSFFFRTYINDDERLIDVRVSIIPTKFGQSIVMRVLDSKNAGANLNDIPMTKEVRETALRILESKEGMILCCGPTGSGKTTTLYSFLNHLNSTNRHIVTVEDPVEYRIPGANQVSVNNYRSFQSILRSFMRHDPDVILVGEIRDDETAAVAINAANTGHLLLSTLHANSAAITIPRLIGLGLDRFTIAGALRGFFSQRLAKQLCQCATPYTLSDEESAFIHSHGVPSLPFVVRNPEGCALCRDSKAGPGYVGRIPVFEFAENTPEVTKAILNGTDPAALQSELNKQYQYQTLTQSALNLASNGLIDFHDAAYIVNGG